MHYSTTIFSRNKGQDENRGNNDKQKVTSQELHNKDQNQTKQSKQMASSKVPASPAEGKKTPKKGMVELFFFMLEEGNGGIFFYSLQSPLHM